VAGAIPRVAAVMGVAAADSAFRSAGCRIAAGCLTVLGF